MADTFAASAGPALAAAFQPGNSKLGSVWHWSLPAWDTCPGRSAGCRVCYARRGHYAWDNVKTGLARNLEASRSPHFVRWAAGQIRRKEMRVVRWHAAGDLYSARYARKCLRVMKLCPDTVFFLYTRSWRVPAVARVLAEMAGLANVHVWYSADAGTGLPAVLPPRVRVAALLAPGDSAEDARRLAAGADLFFRDRSFERGRALKSVGGVRVCPAEQRPGVKVICDRCRICFSPPRPARAGPAYDLLAGPAGRLSLPLVG